MNLNDVIDVYVVDVMCWLLCKDWYEVGMELCGLLGEMLVDWFCVDDDFVLVMLCEFGMLMEVVVCYCLLGMVIILVEQSCLFVLILLVGVGL